jgi:hypothetical protein
MHQRFHHPSPSLLASELPRAMIEMQAFACSIPFLRTLPRGDGHTVLVLPGYTADDPSTAVLRGFLSDRGYRAVPWGLGCNLGPSDKVLRGMASLVEKLSGDSRISIIGWSLGGIFARELGRDTPDAIRSVITLGSPFRLTDLDVEPTAGVAAYNVLASQHSERMEGALRPDDDRPEIRVPVTNIYTRADGVAPWQSCVDVRGGCCENIEIPGSHCGLGHNPVALAVIADRLAQPDGAWKPYEVQGCLSAMVRVGPLPACNDALAAV